MQINSMMKDEVCILFFANSLFSDGIHVDNNAIEGDLVLL